MRESIHDSFPTDIQSSRCIYLLVCMTLHDSSSSRRDAPRVDYVNGTSRRTWDRKSNGIPSWCSLPIPGTCLLVSRNEHVLSERIPIDVKRVYCIGVSPDSDVCIRDFPMPDTKLYHHKNGSIYLSFDPVHGHLIEIPDDMPGIVDTCSDRGMVQLSPERSIVIGDIRLKLFRNTPSRSIREHLRSSEAVDNITHHNTVNNRQPLSPSRSLKDSQAGRNLSTPRSVKAKTKRRRQIPGDSSTIRNVRFTD